MSGWRALGPVVRADLVGRRRGTSLVLLLVFGLATVGIVTGIESRRRAADRWDAAFAEANGAHLALSSGDPSALVRLDAALRTDPRVEGVTDPYRSLGDRELAGARGRGEVRVREMAVTDRPAIARPLLRDGRWAAAGAAGEIVVDRAFALFHGIGVGDRVRVDPGGADLRFVVVGRAVDLIDCLYPNCSPATVWVDPAGFARFTAAGDAGLDHWSFVRLRDPSRTTAVVNEIVAAEPDIGVMDWLDTRGDALAVNDFFGSFLAGFGTFVMIAAAAVVAGLMTTRVLARRREIGLLKAAGFTPAQVSLSMLASHLVVATLAVVLGWAVGGWLAGPLQLQLAQVLGGGSASFRLSSLVTALVVVDAIVLVATIIPSLRTGRLATTAALAPVPPGAGRRSWGVRLARRLGAGPVGTSGVAAASRRPMRTVFTAVALLLAVVAVVVSVGFSRTVDHILGDPAVAGDPFDIEVNRAGADPSAVEAALRSVDGVGRWFTASSGRVSAHGVAFQARGIGGDVAHAGFVVREGRMFRRPGEAVAGFGLLDTLGVEVGDRLAVEAAGRKLTVTVVGRYSESEDTGRVLLVPFADLRTFDPAAAPQQYLVTVSPGSSPPAVAAALHRALGAAAQVRVNDPEDTIQADAFFAAFLLVTVLVILVATANLASTMLLAVRERARDLAVLRAVGCTPAQVTTSTAVASGVVALLGAVAGVPVGLALLGALTDSVGEESGIGPGIGVAPPAWLLVLVVVVAVAAAAALGALVARRSATAPVAELLRYE